MKRAAGLFAFLLFLVQPPAAFACCAVSRAVDRVVNADQTVIILWDPATKRQHFIRQASFKSDAKEDIGFIVPSPSQPDLEEAGDAAFVQLKYITAPIVRSSGGGIGCSKAAAPASDVEVLERKRVAGFDAVVLKAGSAQGLVDWLAQNDYSYSNAVAAWAQPYVEKGWPFTALKVAPGDQSNPDREASALRISFQTDTPLFPYREPDSAEASQQLGAAGRLLRIYFISDQAYEGRFDNGAAWSGQKMWSGDITSDRSSLLKLLKLPASESGPDKWWLTEIEDQWPYTKAPGDVVFSPAASQDELRRSAAVAQHDPLLYATMLFAIGIFVRRRLKEAGSIVGNLAPSD